MIHHLLLKKTNLTNLKSGVGKLDIDKLKNVASNLSSFKSKLYKKDVYNANIKIPDTTNLATNVSLNAKINELKSEITLLLTNLANNASFNANLNKVKGEICTKTNLLLLKIN